MINSMRINLLQMNKMYICRINKRLNIILAIKTMKDHKKITKNRRLPSNIKYEFPKL